MGTVFKFFIVMESIPSKKYFLSIKTYKTNGWIILNFLRGPLSLCFTIWKKRLESENFLLFIDVHRKEPEKNMQSKLSNRLSLMKKQGN